MYPNLIIRKLGIMSSITIEKIFSDLIVAINANIAGEVSPIQILQIRLMIYEAMVTVILEITKRDSSIYEANTAHDITSGVSASRTNRGSDFGLTNSGRVPDGRHSTGRHGRHSTGRFNTRHFTF